MKFYHELTIHEKINAKSYIKSPFKMEHRTDFPITLYKDFPYDFYLNKKRPREIYNPNHAAIKAKRARKIKQSKKKRVELKISVSDILLSVLGFGCFILFNLYKNQNNEKIKLA